MFGLASNRGRRSCAADNSSMAEPLIPIFPLSVVLLPSTPLPLHIFEERYKEMIGLVIAEHGEFGVVLAKEEGIVNIGCSATVDNVLQRYADGRLDILAMGRRRFIIQSIDDEKDYLRASVQFFNDEDVDVVPAPLRLDAIAEYEKLRAISHESVLAEPRLDDPQLSFQLGQFIDDLDHRQALLAMRSETERLEFLIRALPEYIVRREQITLAKRVAPQNGHAKTYKEKA
jgi:ATP-dependent Lon protease